MLASLISTEDSYEKNCNLGNGGFFGNRPGRPWLSRVAKSSGQPFIFDPEDTGLAVAAWVTHQGLPDAGKSAHALMLQISPADLRWRDHPYQAGVAIKGVKGLTLTELGFDIKNDGFTTGPQIEVITKADRYLLPFPFLPPPRLGP